MKRQYSFAILALMLLTACGPSRKEKVKQRLLDKCVSEAGKQSPDAKMQGFIKDYCSCVVDKFDANLTVDELDSLDKMKYKDGGSEIYQRLAPLVEPCVKEQQEKMKDLRKQP